MLLPLRVKNPPKAVPYATYALIALNVLVYFLTTDGLIQIREDVMKNFGFALGYTPLLNAITAMFLHAGLMHIMGNMWFLWLFGPSVEDRLGIGRFLLVYFVSGLLGDLLDGAMSSIVGHPIYGIGASGAIAGVLGAYWYLFAWSTVSVFYWLFFFIVGVADIAATWVIGAFFALDLLNALIGKAFGARDGVAHFVHVGGTLGGIFICLLWKIKRDSSELSQARAIQADALDLTQMPLHALETMLEADPTSPELLRAMIQPAYKLGKEQVIHEAIKRAGVALIDRDPKFAAYYLNQLRGNPDIYQPVHLLRLAGGLERAGEPQQALMIYQMVSGRHPETSDAETALYRMAQCYWNSMKDARNARNCLRQMEAKFPNGQMSVYARGLWNQIGR